MKQAFDFKADGFYNYDWMSSYAPSGYSGILLPGAELATLRGGFGDFVFQMLKRPLYDLWNSRYDCLERSNCQAGLDKEVLEFSLLMGDDVSFDQVPFGDRRHRKYEINLSYAKAIDSKVKFERDTVYHTFDVHYKLQVFYMLMDLMPELVYPFLDKYHKGESVALFEAGTYPNKRILSKILPIIHMAADKHASYLYMDILTVFLLADVFLWYAEIEQRRGLTKGQQKLCFGIQRVAAELMLEEKKFINMAHYAKSAGMSETYFKRRFKNEMGTTPHKFWDEARMLRALHVLRTSNLPFKAIAEKLGFPTVQAFYKGIDLYYGKPASLLKYKDDDGGGNGQVNNDFKGLL